ncbi:MAG: hypothetical protein HFI06_10405 [Eubacterium sp.]|jgi:hypothetical protein|nr:hypothetical protein [Eubacterium sp.]NBI86746.1 hypothetical protein [Lachnospiraceae bacterium]
MQQEQMIQYLRENMVIVAMAAGGICLFIWLLVLIQVTRTRREVHKICEKIRRYFEVILADDTKEEVPEQKEPPENIQPTVCEAAEEAPAGDAKKNEEDAKLLMEIISEVF